MFKLVVCCLLTCLTECAAEMPPNIVFILADDLGWNDVGFHGSNEVSTPNLDALAYSGVIFNQHYSQSLCTPSRAALLTGKYPIHTGTQHNVILEASPWGLPLEEKIMPEILAPLGYESYAIGKWHLGFFKKAYTPTYRGFKYHYGLWNGFHDYFSHNTQSSFSQFEGYDLRRNMEIDWSGRGKYTTQLLTKEAERVIANHNSSRPLFLYMAHLAVHAGSWDRPLQAPPQALKRFSVTKTIQRRTYLAMLWELDQSVGKIFKALMDKGILEETIIVFCSDNGAATIGIHKNTGSNYPLRGEKGTQWEGGVRSTAFLWSTSLKWPGTTLDGLIHITDWLPTLFAAAGGNVNHLDGIDGINQWDYINGVDKAPREEILHNVDDEFRYSALRIKSFKYINGSIMYGNLDGWLGNVEESREEYDTDAVLQSEVGRVVNINRDQILYLRTLARVTCTPLKFKAGAKNAGKESFNLRSVHTRNATRDNIFLNNDGYTENNATQTKKGSVVMRMTSTSRKRRKTYCYPLEEPCLFDIYADPCETNNLASVFPNLVRDFEARLLKYRYGMVPPLNQKVESIANPALYNNTWTYWRDIIPPKLAPLIMKMIDRPVAKAG